MRSVSKASAWVRSGLLGPTVDEAQPNRAFNDGTYTNIVAFGEIWCPAWTDVVEGNPRSAGSNVGLYEAAVLAVRWFIWRVVLDDQDKRWRLLVHRKARRSRWKVVRVEFFDSADAAKARAQDILTNWRQFARNDYADAAPITAAERRAMRKESRSPKRRRGVGFRVARMLMLFLLACVLLFCLVVVIVAIATS